MALACPVKLSEWRDSRGRSRYRNRGRIGIIFGTNTIDELMAKCRFRYRLRPRKNFFHSSPIFPGQRHAGTA